MDQTDLLYSGLVATALLLSIWTGALVTAACLFFAPTFFAPHASRPSRRPGS